MNERSGKVFLLVVGAVLCIALAGGALWSIQTDRPGKPVAVATEPAQAIQPAEELVVELPDDGRAFYVSLFVHADWKQRKAERELVAAWQSDRLLRSLYVQSHSRVYTPDDPMVKSRYAATLPAIPCVRVQDSTGKVLYQASGQEATDYAAQRSAVGRLFPWPRPCPRPNPDKPKPDVDVDVDVDAKPVPDVVPDVAPEPDGVPWAAVILIAAAVGVLVFLATIVKEVVGTVKAKP